MTNDKLYKVEMKDRGKWVDIATKRAKSEEEALKKTIKLLEDGVNHQQLVETVKAIRDDSFSTPKQILETLNRLTFRVSPVVESKKFHREVKITEEDDIAPEYSVEKV